MVAVAAVIVAVVGRAVVAAQVPQHHRVGGVVRVGPVAAHVLLIEVGALGVAAGVVVVVVVVEVPKLHAGFWSDAAPKPKPMAKRIVHHAAGGASSFHPRPRSGRTRRQRSGSVPPTQQGGRPVGGAEACGGGVDMDASPGVGVSSLHSTSPSRPLVTVQVAPGIAAAVRCASSGVQVRS